MAFFDARSRRLDDGVCGFTSDALLVRPILIDGVFLRNACRIDVASIRQHVFCNCVRTSHRRSHFDNHLHAVAIQRKDPLTRKGEGVLSKGAQRYPSSDKA